MAMTIGDLMDIQTALQEKYQGIWEGDHPETAKNHLLYAVEEVGEVAAILKKRGAQAVVEDAGVRAHFCEEMADVFMYLCDVMLCCGVTAEEFETAYRAKAAKNLERDFVGEHARYLKREE
ncbi:MAG: nucleotide pyrophosphohydrolase [Clostridia bacterium]|nr:nucleotide pyrophosphohydrolase [Clostridia bacterium]